MWNESTKKLNKININFNTCVLVEQPGSDRIMFHEISLCKDFLTNQMAETSTRSRPGCTSKTSLILINEKKNANFFKICNTSHYFLFQEV